MSGLCFLYQLILAQNICFTWIEFESLRLILVTLQVKHFILIALLGSLNSMETLIGLITFYLVLETCQVWMLALDR